MIEKFIIRLPQPPQSEDASKYSEPPCEFFSLEGVEAYVSAVELAFQEANEKIETAFAEVANLAAVEAAKSKARVEDLAKNEAGARQKLETVSARLREAEARLQEGTQQREALERRLFAQAYDRAIVEMSDKLKAMDRPGSAKRVLDCRKRKDTSDAY